VQEAILRPTRIYAKAVLNLIRDFRVLGLAHITGGGLVENVPRVLPSKCQAVLHADTWPRPAIFSYLQKLGQLELEEMYRVFNMGLGMIVVVPSNEADEVLTRLASLGEKAYRVGEIARRDQDAPPIRIV
jgi:phosphoribosylformylglycinamidine cyclo-ligase